MKSKGIWQLLFVDSCHLSFAVDSIFAILGTRTLDHVSVGPNNNISNHPGNKWRMWQLLFVDSCRLSFAVDSIFAILGTRTLDHVSFGPLNNISNHLGNKWRLWQKLFVDSCLLSFDVVFVIVISGEVAFDPKGIWLSCNITNNPMKKAKDFGSFSLLILVSFLFQSSPHQHFWCNHFYPKAFLHQQCYQLFRKK